VWVAGVGVESSWHVYGVLADGLVVFCSKDTNRELFYNVLWSHGTLDFLLSAEFRTGPCKPYVHLRYTPVPVQGGAGGLRGGAARPVLRARRRRTSPRPWPSAAIAYGGARYRGRPAAPRLSRRGSRSSRLPLRLVGAAADLPSQGYLCGWLVPPRIFPIKATSAAG
jgi:hypothetical protein